MTVLLLCIAFAASLVGAICGVGGGVVIKPVLDLLNLTSVSAANLMSGCTVLCMSLYSVGRSVLAGDSAIQFKTATPLAVGAAAGGVFGKGLFDLLKAASPQPDRVGGWQALVLAVVCAGCLLYNLCENKIKTKQLSGAPAAAAIGCALGCMSSFLSIGGGPINLVVLSYFFSMSTKVAAANSLYVIVFSQLASLLSTLLSGSLPEVSPLWLCVMAAGGVLGGVCGRACNRVLSGEAVRKLLMSFIVVIIGISVFNAVRFLG